MHRLRIECAVCLTALSVIVTAALNPPPANGAVERYLSEAAYLTRLSQLGYGAVREGFDSSAWDAVRTLEGQPRSLPAVTSSGVTWEAAALDVWDFPTTNVHGVSTSFGAARTGHWGVFEDHKGDPLPTTLRASAPGLIYGIGGWFDTDPDGESIGFLFEGRTTANAPGYVIPNLGAMYPGRTTSTGHAFVGVVDPDGFASVVLTGTLELSGGELEGGANFGADDLTLGVASGLEGDYNDDGAVDAADYAAWRDSLGAPAGSLPNDPNAGPIGAPQYATWRDSYGASAAPTAVAAPEPAAWVGALAVFAAGAPRARRRGGPAAAKAKI